MLHLSSSRYNPLVSGGMTNTSSAVGHADRAAWMRILSLAAWDEFEGLAGDLAATPHVLLRAPESGLVMLRGRMGATGAAFNFGEATVTRCAVRLSSGQEGHAYVMRRRSITRPVYSSRKRRAKLCARRLC